MNACFVIKKPIFNSCGHSLKGNSFKSSTKLTSGINLLDLLAKRRTFLVINNNELFDVIKIDLTVFKVLQGKISANQLRLIYIVWNS